MENNSNLVELKDYKIFVNGLKLPIRLGCRAEERKQFQVTQLDLVFEVKLGFSKSKAEFIPDIDRTVCYLTAAEFACNYAARKEWDLIENFLESLIAALFERFPACLAIESCLTKFVVAGCEGAGVKIFRSRS